MLHLIRLFLTGDFTGDMVPALGHEDSALVDAVLTAREFLAS